MQVQIFALGMFQTNGYLLVDEGSKQAVVIDPGQDPDALLSAIEEQGLKVIGIWLTHAHLDHIAGVGELKEATGAPVLVHEIEKDWMTDPMLNGSGRYTEYFEPITGPAADRFVAAGDLLKLGDTEFEVRFTPGHTPGHVVYVTEGMVFAGDTLFNNGIGRTDMPGGDTAQLVKSIREQLYTLPEETVVFCGHGPETTIGHERKNNWAVNDQTDLLQGGGGMIRF
ncbi:MBL fold metallo-hydrolase [Tumebacillus sp. ITR2]|uniref:MBL fold metallo-hydrolase n=1 Tax=Tumebacillus amylolyticus TaxID=2801339 RepID=A0ABS1JBK1_9BACL|nr:MBL fold metallo-hydrolase [Tumebacillus amylolyticus]MBL0387655.1 MBL fold metallo-hydrolase [Tumebacillus amylolyticus]